MLSTYSIYRYRFSVSTIAINTLTKFQQRQKTAQNLKISQTIKKSSQKCFVHPYSDIRHKPFASSLQVMQSFADAVGAEQVSSHYQNFAYSRKDMLLFLSGLLISTGISMTPDFHFFANTFITSWIYFFGMFYFFLQLKSAMAVPLLNRFYGKIVHMQINNLQKYYSENIQIRIRQLMNIAKLQIDYKQVHSSYLEIRNSTLLTFLINEQISIKNHLAQRAMTILKQVQALENINQSKIVNQVMTETLTSVDKAYAENKQQIEKDMFQLALQGIANGKMDYNTKDPVIPYVVKTIQKIVDKFNAISPEEQLKLITLKPQQIEEIRASDAKIRDQFLQNQPKIDGSLKKHQIISKILSKWGKQAQ